MKFEQLIGLESWLITSKVHHDDRGHFLEWFKFSEIKRITDVEFCPVQANRSRSKSGAVRGIHFDSSMEGQRKLVSVTRGRIMDYLVDLSPESETFGMWESIELSSDDGKQILIGPKIGHAFQSLEDDTEIVYLLSKEYSSVHEKTIDPLDSNISLKFKLQPSFLSERDRNAPAFLKYFGIEAKNEYKI